MLDHIMWSSNKTLDPCSLDTPSHTSLLPTAVPIPFPIPIDVIITTDITLLP